MTLNVINDETLIPYYPVVSVNKLLQVWYTNKLKKA